MNDHQEHDPWPVFIFGVVLGGIGIALCLISLSAVEARPEPVLPDEVYQTIHCEKDFLIIETWGDDKALPRGEQL